MSDLQVDKRLNQEEREKKKTGKKNFSRVSIYYDVIVKQCIFIYNELHSIGVYDYMFSLEIKTKREDKKDEKGWKLFLYIQHYLPAWLIRTFAFKLTKVLMVLLTGASFPNSCALLTIWPLI